MGPSSLAGLLILSSISLVRSQDKAKDGAALTMPGSPSVESAATFHTEVPAEPCMDRKCKLPDCFCSGTKPPKGLEPQNIPQFVMLTFDDSINPNVHSFYEKLFTEKRRNPNGCPIRGTFFVTHEWNDYWLAKKLYAAGHEIADHSITHETTKAFKEAKIDRWVKEICGMKKILEIFGQIRADDIKGFRAPYLQAGGDLMFEAMSRCGVMYDTSLPAAENNPPMWPHTLNFKSTQECKIGPCPKNSHKGLWEVPMVYYNDQQVPPSVCAMIDACFDNGTRESAFNLLMENFLRHYVTNRAPFPMFMHAGWFTVNPYRWEALNDFIDVLLTFPDVYFVTVTDVLEWIKKPTPCETDINTNRMRTCTLAGMKKWSCNSDSVLRRDPVCPDSQRQSCVLTRVAHNVTCERRFSTCFECPNTYPWLGNPDGNIYEVLDEEIPVSERHLWNPPRGFNLEKPEAPEAKKPTRYTTPQMRDRILNMLRSRLKDNNADKNILARVLGDVDAKIADKKFKRKLARN